MKRITSFYKKVFFSVTVALISISLSGCSGSNPIVKNDALAETQQSEAISAVQASTEVLYTNLDSSGKKHFIDVAKTIDVSEITAREFIIYDGNKNIIVYGRNADQRIQAASITKLLTVLTALDYLKTGEYVPIGDEIELVPECTSIANLPQGDSIEVSDLVKAVLIPSGADAVYVLAINAARRESGIAYSDTEALVRFAELMNKKAVSLGMTDSYFSNPVGLDSGEEAYNKNKIPYTTPNDILLLVKASYSNDQIREAVSQGECMITLASGETVLLSNTNLFVNKNSVYYNENVNGMKTGYTGKAGRCLVLTVEENKKTKFILLFGYKTVNQLYSEAETIVEACLPTISSQNNAS